MHSWKQTEILKLKSWPFTCAAMVQKNNLAKIGLIQDFKSTFATQSKWKIRWSLYIKSIIVSWILARTLTKNKPKLY